MKAFRSFCVAFGLACSTATAAIAQETSAPVEVQAGRAVALKVCASCHFVSAGPQRKPVMKPPAPSFSAIANRPGTTARSLLVFLETKHQSVADYRQMPGLKVTDEQARDVVRHIMSLRKQPS